MMANLTALCFPLFSSGANLTPVSIRRLSHDRGWFLTVLRTPFTWP